MASSPYQNLNRNRKRQSDANPYPASRIQRSNVPTHTPQALCRLAAGNIARLIAIAHQLKLRRARLARSTETDPSRPRRCNSLRLAPMDILALYLRHVAQQLQHNIGNQDVGHIRARRWP